MRNALPVSQYLRESLRPQHIPQSRRSQQPRRPVVVFDIGDCHGGIVHSVVHDSVNCHGHSVMSEDLLGGHVKSDRSEVQYLTRVDAREDEEGARPFGPSLAKSPHSKDDRSLVLSHDFVARANGEREEEDGQGPREEYRNVFNAAGWRVFMRLIWLLGI